MESASTTRSRRPLLASLAGLAAVFLAVAGGGAARAEERGPGQVTVPLGAYTELIERLRGGDGRGGAPGFALGPATLALEASEHDGSVTATARAELTVKVLRDASALVPLLPNGTAVTSVLVDGSADALVATPEGLAVSLEKGGARRISLVYTVGGVREARGTTLAFPVPQAPSTALTALLPGSGLFASVVPGRDVHTIDGGGASTRLTATLPQTSLVQIAWRAPGAGTHALGRARYVGELVGSALRLTATFAIELHADEPVLLPIFPAGARLGDVQVDGKPASVTVDDEGIKTTLSGRGRHEVEVVAEFPIVKDEGAPHVDLVLPEVPVSSFEVTLPGRKELKVEPDASVKTEPRGATTVARFFAPMAGALTLTWTESIPEESRVEASINATIVHAARAEEGVLEVTAYASFEVTRGEAQTFELEAPADVQINKVEAPGGGIADWREEPAQAGRPRRLRVFLDRKVKGQLAFEVSYERPLPPGTTATALPAPAGSPAATTAAGGAPVAVPLLRALSVHRQRGMVALLQTAEMSLKPVGEKALNKVGENQLPPEVKDALKATIAHTYRYGDELPELTVKTVAPERRPATFDAQVDTLISIGEVSMKGASTVEVNVKQGTMNALTLELPADVTVLSLTAPSLRAYHAEPAPDRPAVQTVAVEFTAEMEGLVKVEVAYERVLRASTAELAVPVPAVVGAPSEHGRIAVEALAAVEVEPRSTERLSSVELAELPQALVLRTTNPILLAYKYVRTDARAELVLRVTRHAEVAVQAAIIDEARYRTLVTRDGLAVTVADWTVRNSRKQFLRIELPAGSEVWSLVVGGKAEKPALATEDGEPGAETAPAAAPGKGSAPGAATPASGKASARPPASAGTAVLVKLLSAAEIFPVQMVYATRLDKLGSVGTLCGRLPRPDLVVTSSHLDLFLPEDLRYGRPRTDLELAPGQEPVGGTLLAHDYGERVDRQAMEQELAASKAAAPVSGAGGAGAFGTPILESFRIAVPARGLHLAFDKLYASEARDGGRYAIPFRSANAVRAGTVLAGLGTGAVAASALALLGLVALPRRRALVLATCGALVAVVALLALDADPRPAALVALAACAYALARRLSRAWPAIQARLRPARPAAETGAPGSL